MLKSLTKLFAIILLSATTAMAANHRFTLVIDAGHGGHDAGAIGAISKEKNINLRTALAFGNYVEKNCPDVKVIYTRKTDIFVTLHDRADIANKAKADLFISIHTNSLPAGHIARGFETYTLGMHRADDNLEVAKRENSVILVEKDYKEHYEGFDPNSAESYIIFEFMQDRNMERSVNLAKYIQTNVCSLAGRQNKGVKQAGFLVLRETSMPSCLIELGFISTSDEERFLNTETGIDNIARGIYNAFATYKRRYDSNISVPYKVEEAVSRTPSVVPETPKTEVRVTKLETKKKNDEPAVSEKDDDSAKATEQKEDTSAPIFKIQIFAADHVLNTSDKRLKGHSEAKYFKEGPYTKYTIGESSNYTEIYQLRKKILTDFPDCFIIAFKNGEKVNINEAIKEFKANKK